MSTSRHSEAAPVEAALVALLDHHADAALCAIGPDGICVTMPDSVPTDGHHVVVARSPVDVVAPEDRVVVISAWERARMTGAAQSQVAVRLANEPDRTVVLHLLDAQRRHGVFLGVFVPTDDEEVEGRVTLLDQEVLPLPPRFAQVRQNEVGVFLEVDEAITQILGWSVDELVGHLSLEFIHQDDHELAVDNWMKMLASREPVSRVRLRHRHRDGSWVWMEITNHNMLEDPEYGYVVAEMINVSDEMAAHEALRAREQLLERLAEALPVGVVQVDADRRVVYTNDRLHAILGVPQATTVDEQMAAVLPDDRGGLAHAFDAVLNSRLDSDLEVRLEMSPQDDNNNNNEVRRCMFSLRALTAETGEVTGAIVCVADVTESTRLRDELHMRATFDDITRCHNRASTMAALETLLSDTGAESRPAVIFIDLDRFKEVNDKLGHAAGDELLGVVAKRLLRAVRADDIVGRIGGDEFLVIGLGITDAGQAMTTANRMAETFRHEVRLKAGRLQCRASIGVAWSSEPELDAEALVAMADAAMYEAKRSGSGHPILHQRHTAVPRHSK
jgi:diguanylate cyclase (GGDEF)-like protein/PAS domain S-box-containing protein